MGFEGTYGSASSLALVAGAFPLSMGGAPSWGNAPCGVPGLARPAGGGVDEENLLLMFDIHDGRRAKVLLSLLTFSELPRLNRPGRFEVLAFGLDVDGVLGNAVVVSLTGSESAGGVTGPGKLDCLLAWCTGGGVVGVAASDGRSGCGGVTVCLDSDVGVALEAAAGFRGSCSAAQSTTMHHIHTAVRDSRVGSGGSKS